MSIHRGYEGLTERESEVLLFATEGRTDKEIAKELDLSLSTIHTYWIRIRSKLGGVNRAEVIAGVIQRTADQSLSQKEQENQLLSEEIRRRTQAENALRQSQHQLQAILDGAPTAVFVKDHLRRYLLTNKEFDRRMGLPKGQIIGRNDQELVPHLAPIFEKDDIHVLATGERIETEYGFEDNGRNVVHLIGKFPLFDSRGKPYAVCGFSHDITRRKQMEVEIKQSRERLMLAADGAKVGFWEWDFATDRVNWSDNIERIRDLEPGSFDGTFEGLKGLMHPDDLPRFLSDIEAAIAAKGDFETEFRTRSKDGQYLWMYGKGRIICDAEGQPVSLVGISMDITDRKEAEAALVQSEHRYRLLVETNRDLVALLDKRGRVLYVSPSAASIFGFTEAEMASQRGFSFFDPTDRKKAMQDFMRLVSIPGGSYGSRYRMRRKDETTIWMEGTATNLLDNPAIRAIVIHYHEVHQPAAKQIDAYAAVITEAKLPISPA